MKWLRCCYCCCCWAPKAEKVTSLDDASSLIHDPSEPEDPRAFYVPRRHSSFNTSTYNAVSSQPSRCQSDSGSSTEDEESAPVEQRGRCWSAVPATSATTDVAALNNCLHNNRPPEPRSPLAFDRHHLSDIRENESLDRVEECGSTPSDDVCGYLHFSTAYDEQEQKLTVFVEKATDLPKKSTVNSEHQLYSTYVRLSITSSRKHFLLTRTVKHSLNPLYKEEHTFQTNRSKWKSLGQDTLRLSVYDSDRQGRHDAIGHALLPLSKILDDEENFRLSLTPMSMIVSNLGQLLVGLFYSATQSRLSIHVIKARHLRLDSDFHKKSLRPLNKGKAECLDTFAKITLMCGGQKVKTNRSQVVTEKSDPMYSHKSDFVVPPTFLPDSSVVVTVMAKGVLGRSIALGRVAAGPYAETATGTPTHWGRMLQESRSVVQWRNLYL